jgi:uncharacterized protein (DUF2345 family)
MTVHTEQTRPTMDWAGWGMSAPPEPPADDDEPETVHEVSARWWQVALAAAFVLAVLAAVVFLAARAGLGGSTPDPAQVQRATFVDSFGRQCTQVTAGNAVALDCDYKPVESRLGSLLDGSQP